MEATQRGVRTVWLPSTPKTVWISPAISQLNPACGGAYSKWANVGLFSPGPAGIRAMSKALGSRTEMITPDDFEKIDGVFREMVQERNLAFDSEEAIALAARLISLFQSGIHDQAALKLMAS